MSTAGKTPVAAQQQSMNALIFYQLVGNQRAVEETMPLALATRCSVGLELVKSTSLVKPSERVKFCRTAYRGTVWLDASDEGTCPSGLIVGSLRVSALCTRLA